MKTKKQLQHLVQAAGEKVVAHSAATAAPGPALASDLVTVIGLVDELIQHLPEGPIIIPLNARMAASAEPVEPRVHDGLGGTMSNARNAELEREAAKPASAAPTAHQIGDDEVEAFRDVVSAFGAIVPSATLTLSGLAAAYGVRVRNYGVPTREAREEELLEAGLSKKDARVWAGCSFDEVVRQAEASRLKVLELLDAIDTLHARAQHTLRQDADLREAAVQAGATAAAQASGKIGDNYWRRVAEVVIEAALGVEA